MVEYYIGDAMLDRLQSSSARGDEAAGLAVGRGLRGLESAAGEAGPASIWLLLAFGFAGAGFSAFVACSGLDAHAASWHGAFFRAVADVVRTVMGGAAGVCACWVLLPAEPRVGRTLICRRAAVGWIFLPCFFLWEQTLWALAIVVGGTMFAAASVRELFPMTAANAQEVAPEQVDGLGTLYGLRIRGVPFWKRMLISLCMQVAVIFTALGSMESASLLLAAAVFALAWGWWSGLGDMAPRWDSEKLLRREILLSAAAVLLTCFSLALQARGVRGIFGLGYVPHVPVIARAPAQVTRLDLNYVGIILYPPPVKTREIVAPAPVGHSLRAMAKPVVISFNGTYWNFRAPNKGPGTGAHVAHGKPTDTTLHMRSSDRTPLLMEAHQVLGKAIDVGCCGAIEVAITNADTRAGSIALDVSLADSGAKGGAVISLGKHTVVSSEVGIPDERDPVNEVLRFTIPPAVHLRRFDEIKVVFLPSERATMGARVAIRSFTLVPR